MGWVGGAKLASSRPGSRCFRPYPSNPKSSCSSVLERWYSLPRDPPTNPGMQESDHGSMMLSLQNQRLKENQPPMQLNGYVDHIDVLCSS